MYKSIAVVDLNLKAKKKVGGVMRYYQIHNMFLFQLTNQRYQPIHTFKIIDFFCDTSWC